MHSYGNCVKIGDIELSGPENLDSLIEKAKDLYLWKEEAKPLKRTNEDIDLEKIFDNSQNQSKTEINEFFNI